MTPPRKSFLAGMRAACAVLLLLFTFMAHAQGQGPAGMSEAVGQLQLQINNCFNPDHKGPHATYMLVDTATENMTELDVSAMDPATLKPGNRIRVKGGFIDAVDLHQGKRLIRKVLKVHSLIDETAAGVKGGNAPAPGDAAVAEPPIANAATLTDLSCLLIFASAPGSNLASSTITAIENMLFHDTNNVSAAIQHASYGHYRLTHAQTVTVSLDYDPSTKTSNQVVADMVAAAQALGYNTTNYSRHLVFPPKGTQIFGAYATVPGRRSVYSYNYTSDLDIYVHELGHNFGFNHSGKDGGEYGDTTCAMGSVGSSTLSATYSVGKKAQANWFAPFPGSFASLTSDATYDLYPISDDPDTIPGMRGVRINGTTYHTSYCRDLPPYGNLESASLADKVYIHDNTASQPSWRVGDLAEGGSQTVGSTNIIFERYGDAGKNFATVSFDLDDGNTKPVADAKSIPVLVNSPRAVIVTGSDADNDPLQYALATQPAHGTLTGTAPNLTYTPNTGYAGGDSFMFQVNDGKISSFATVSVTVTSSNTPPVANNQSVSVYLNAARSVTLAGSDSDGNDLSYSVVASPSHGALTGTPPQLIYTPDIGYSGSDSFTFKASDGLNDSNTATVSITVSSSPNTPPSVAAGADFTTTLAPLPLAYGWSHAPWTGDADSGISNAFSHTIAHCFGNNQGGGVTVNGVAFTESFNTSGTGWSVSGSKSDWDGDDDANITGGSEKLAQEFIFNGNPRTITFTGLTVGEDYEATFFSVAWETGSRNQTFSATGGGSAFINQDAYNNNNGIRISCVYTATATTQEFTITPEAANTFHLYAMTNKGVSQDVATVNLDGTVGDVENDPLATTWSLVSGPATVAFANPSAADTAATFTQPGTYVLRLTVSDGYNESFDEVTIIVRDDGIVTVPDVVGMARMTAESAIASAGGTVGLIVYIRHPAVPAGSVVSQNPSAGTELAPSTPVDLVISLGPLEQYHYPETSIPVSATLAGTIADTQASDGIYQQLTELATTSGSPSSRTSYLEHKWSFTVAAADTLSFHIEAHHTANTENDHFRFAYSTSGVDGPYTDMLTVTQTSDDNTLQSFQMPAGISGTVHVRVIDTDRTGGNSVTHSLFIDRMYFQSVDNWPKVVTVSFDPNGGGAPDPVFKQATYGSAYGPLATVNRAGYTFEGWFSAASGGTEVTASSTVSSTADHTLYAQWVNRYEQWAVAKNLTGSDALPGANPDNDSLTNLLEYAFGTDPKVGGDGSITYDGSQVLAPGMPMVWVYSVGENPVEYRAVFARRKDYQAAGLVYTVQFSAGLDEWVTNHDAPTVMADQGNAGIDAVHIPYPLMIQTSRGFEIPAFFRVAVSMN